MGPHLIASDDLQRFLGSNLISHQTQGKTKLHPPELRRRLGNGGSQSARALWNTHELPVCNYQYSNSHIPQFRHSNLNYFIWTGFPLVSLASGLLNGHDQCSYESSKMNDREKYLTQTHEYGIPWSLEENVYSNVYPIPISSYLDVNDINVQETPPIFTEEDKEEISSFRNLDDVQGHNFCSFYSPEDCYAIKAVSPLIFSHPTSLDEQQFREEMSFISNESHYKYIPKLACQVRQSNSLDFMWKNSFDITNNCLPQIVKPHKRLREDKNMCTFQDQICSRCGILTLKPYQPLCYKYYDSQETQAKMHEVELSDNDFKNIKSLVSEKMSKSRANKVLTANLSDHTTITLQSQNLIGDDSVTVNSISSDCPSVLASSVSHHKVCYPHFTPLYSECEYFENLSSALFLMAEQDPLGQLTKEGSRISTAELESEDQSQFFTSDYESNDLKMTSRPRLSLFKEDEMSIGDRFDTYITSGSEPSSHVYISSITSPYPPQRPWISLEHPTRQNPSCVFTVMCYNILCPKYATRQMYGYCPTWALNWEYRRKCIMEEIKHYSADIISLQSEGYDGIFSPKSRAKIVLESERKHVDGCAIFFRSNKFSLIREHLVEFNQLAMANAEGSDDMLNRVQTKDNIGLAALLQINNGAFENGVLPGSSGIHQPLLVCTAHIHWDPEYCDVKLIQTMMLMGELRGILEEAAQSFRPGSQKPDINNIPLLLCGDFNSLPESGVVEFLTSGRVSADHPDFKRLGYKDCLRKLSSTDKTSDYTHCFMLANAYKEDFMTYTNYTYDFKGIIDYIFFPTKHMKVLGLLGSLDLEWLKENKIAGCPHPHIPSDHFPLLVEFEITPQSSFPVLPNGLIHTR
ncbi:uncharacterized protein LOC143255860 isoform X2 [Tachypleus tridentatus]|uniref:uncharacterized protein LOC143255860 isoform X2 n=1 Tax=Tachypleus tridentatus TaxID=6853 RepID=UPI003FCFE945